MGHARGGVLRVLLVVLLKFCAAGTSPPVVFSFAAVTESDSEEGDSAEGDVLNLCHPRHRPLTPEAASFGGPDAPPTTDATRMLRTAIADPHVSPDAHPGPCASSARWSSRRKQSKDTIKRNSPMISPCLRDEHPESSGVDSDVEPSASETGRSGRRKPAKAHMMMLRPASVPRMPEPTRQKRAPAGSLPPHLRQRYEFPCPAKCKYLQSSADPRIRGFKSVYYLNRRMGRTLWRMCALYPTRYNIFGTKCMRKSVSATLPPAASGASALSPRTRAQRTAAPLGAGTSGHARASLEGTAAQARNDVETPGFSARGAPRNRHSLVRYKESFLSSLGLSARSTPVEGRRRGQMRAPLERRAAQQSDVGEVPDPLSAVAVPRVCRPLFHDGGAAGASRRPRARSTGAPVVGGTSGKTRASAERRARHSRDVSERPDPFPASGPPRFWRPFLPFEEPAVSSVWSSARRTAVDAILSGEVPAPLGRSAAQQGDDSNSPTSCTAVGLWARYPRPHGGRVAGASETLRAQSSGAPLRGGTRGRARAGRTAVQPTGDDGETRGPPSARVLSRCWCRFLACSEGTTSSLRSCAGETAVVSSPSGQGPTPLQRGAAQRRYDGEPPSASAGCPFGNKLFTRAGPEAAAAHATLMRRAPDIVPPSALAHSPSRRMKQTAVRHSSSASAPSASDPASPPARETAQPLSSGSDSEEGG